MNLRNLDPHQESSGCSQMPVSGLHYWSILFFYLYIVFIKMSLLHFLFNNKTYLFKSITIVLKINQLILQNYQIKKYCWGYDFKFSSTIFNTYVSLKCAFSLHCQQDLCKKYRTHPFQILKLIEIDQCKIFYQKQSAFNDYKKGAINLYRRSSVRFCQ